MAKVAAKAKDRPVKKTNRRNENFNNSLLYCVSILCCSRFHCTDELLQEQCGNQPCNL